MILVYFDSDSSTWESISCKVILVYEVFRFEYHVVHYCVIVIHVSSDCISIYPGIVIPVFRNNESGVQKNWSNVLCCWF